ncbi:MAG: hypothetical protein U0841_28180 [Chloroflexia bacterium]
MVGVGRVEAGKPVRRVYRPVGLDRAVPVGEEAEHAVGRIVPVEQEVADRGETEAAAEGVDRRARAVGDGDGQAVEGGQQRPGR